MFSSVKARISQTEAAQKFFESDDYSKVKEIRQNYQQFKSNLKDGVDTSQSPLV